MNWISEKIMQLQAALASHTQNTTAPTVEFNDLKVSELKAIAKKKGFKGYTNLRKAELVEMLQQN